MRQRLNPQAIETNGKGNSSDYHLNWGDGPRASRFLHVDARLNLNEASLAALRSRAANGETDEEIATTGSTGLSAMDVRKICRLHNIVLVLSTEVHR